MTDAGPRIFRTLEKTDGRDSFDAIVRAAVATFAALERPSARQVLEFGRLVLPLFDRTDAETRRMLAASLAPSPHLPRDLVERLLTEPTAVAAPFFLESPLLTPADLATLRKRRDAATKALLKARSEPERTAGAPKRRRSRPAQEAVGEDRPLLPAAPAMPAKPRISPDRQTALLSTGTPDLPLPASAREPATKPATADEARSLLRQLATTGRRQPAPVPPAAEADLLSLALGRDVERFYALLSARLLLDGGQVGAIEADETGRELAAALKALDTGKADAMTMLMMLKPAVGSDVAAFEALERIYGTLDVLACRTRFPIGPGAFAEGERHRPLYSETRAVVRPEARPAVFGRRASIPSEGSRKRRS